MTTTSSLQQVKVRMYRPGLGDCFLLTFVNTAGAARYMLVDCGVYMGTKGGSDRLLQIIQDIKKQTGGNDQQRGKLHVLVATHEHADHLSGFDSHQQVFQQQFSIDEVWMAWTEDKNDPKVQETYGALKKTPVEALRAALEQLQKAGKPNDQMLKNVLAFIAEGQMDSVKSLGGKQLYLRPNSNGDGPTTVLDWDDFGVHFHVLGPPEDPKSIMRSDPPKDKNQIYHGEALNLSTAFTTAVLKTKLAGLGDPNDPELLDLKELLRLCQPFDDSQGIPLERAKQAADPFFTKFYGFEEAHGHGPAWRRIDADWLSSAGEMALNLDNDTNNTSLVLGIELSLGGKVLLFAADAQYGNWQSWAPTRKGADLLNRTVLYKVGHHGSHNATLKNGGLDKMVHPELVAMIPVDTARAQNLKPHPFRMPEDLLENLLLNQTKGRLIIACEGSQPGAQCPEIPFHLPANKPASISEQAWAQWTRSSEWAQFAKSVTWDTSAERLWIEYTLT